jgi:hypothetical protein
LEAFLQFFGVLIYSPVLENIEKRFNFLALHDFGLSSCLVVDFLALMGKPTAGLPSYLIAL